MSARLSARFAALKQEGRAGLVAYVMGGDPDFDASLAILKALPAAGADVIELGFPFSDPMADGPAIQAAAQRALKGGASLRSTLELVAAFRESDTTTPVVLMGYANPVAALGEEAFAHAAAAAGADGAIVVDMPPEEDLTLRQALDDKGLSLIRLVAPTTDAERLPHVLGGVSGFVYYISLTGVTGAAAPVADASAEAVARLKASTNLPIAVGFGVRTPDIARAIAQTADAVVVGSVLVEAVARANEGGAPLSSVPAVVETVQTLAQAVRSARTSQERR